MTRRHFLSTAAAPVFLPSQSPNDLIRVGMIGVGNRGSFLLQQVLKFPNVKVVAICDIDPAALQRAGRLAAGHAPDLMTDFRKLLDRKDIDAVFIATPVDLHKEMAVAALEVGKHIYCEKPMARTPEECRQVVNAAKTAKGIFQQGFQLRHDPYRAASVKFIHSGGIGKVLFLQAYRHTGDLPRQTGWYFDARRSGDNIVEQACHIIDIYNWVMQTHPLRAYGSGGINLYKDEPPGRTTMDHYAVIYEFPGDVRFSFSHIYFDPPGFTGIQERVFCSEAAIELPKGLVYSRTQKGAPHKIEVPGEGEDMNYRSVAAFFDHARNRKQPDLNNAESARISTLTAIMGRTSIYEKRVVQWPEVDV
jgi:myo-inositol 2-dehydrogenase/D-chiro-inositol 1-dehydrogenase